MRKLYIIFFGLFICLSLTGILSAQAPVKIAVIDSSLFENEQAGITKYVNGFKQINAEIQPKTAELQTMLTKVQTLEKEAGQLNEAFQKNPNGPIKASQIQAKVDEIEQIKRQGSYKQEDLNKYVQTRRQQLLGPIVKDISTALQAFAKQKGYTVIFDLAKDNIGFLSAIGDEKIDVTKDFIAFYNARSATLTVPSAPKK